MIITIVVMIMTANGDYCDDQDDHDDNKDGDCDGLSNKGDFEAIDYNTMKILVMTRRMVMMLSISTYNCKTPNPLASILSGFYHPYFISSSTAQSLTGQGL